MKTKLKKTFIHFASFSLPLFWIYGFATAMMKRYKYEETNLFLYCVVCIALICLLGQMWRNRELREIKGWYRFACVVGELGVLALSLWVHLTF